MSYGLARYDEAYRLECLTLFLLFKHVLIGYNIPIHV